jgi:hypothetical protein
MQPSACVSFAVHFPLCAACLLANKHVLCLSLPAPAESSLSHAHNMQTFASCLLRHLPADMPLFKKAEGSNSSGLRSTTYSVSSTAATAAVQAATVLYSAVMSTAAAACCVLELQIPVSVQAFDTLDCQTDRPANCPAACKLP